MAALAFVGLIVDRESRQRLVAVAATGGALMAHDWKDHSVWFRRGPGTQP